MIADFDIEKCEDIAREELLKPFPHLSSAYEDAAKEFKNNNEPEKAENFFMLARACSLRISASDDNVTLEPQFNGACGIDDFDEKHLMFFSQVLESIDNYAITARLADILWCRYKEHKYIETAIKYYRRFTLSGKDGDRNSFLAYQRLLFLTIRCLRDKELLSEIENDLVQLFKSSCKKTLHNALEIAQIFKQFKLYRYNKEFASELFAIGENFDSENEYCKAESFYLEAAFWFKKGGNDEQESIAIFQAAKANVNNGKTRGSFICMVEINSALGMLRKRPRKHRVKHDIYNLISRLEQELDQLRDEAKHDMCQVSCGEFDYSKYVRETQHRFEGLNKEDALHLLLRGLNYCDIAAYKEKAMELIKAHPLHAFINGVCFDDDGRIIDHLPGISDLTSIDQNSKHVLHDVNHYYNTEIAIKVLGFICPALEVMHKEHEITENDFLKIVRACPIIPPNRYAFFVKGLWAGYNYDYITSLHILTNQIEYIIRVMLRALGVNTKLSDDDSNETEKSINSLIEAPELSKVLHQNIIDEIKLLFCNPIGLNIRNNICHALVTSEEFNSTGYIYAWWFILRFVSDICYIGSNEHSSMEAARGENEG